MKTATMRVSELVFDFGLYPRERIDSGHLANMATARESGIAFPPLLVDETSKRIIDGFHRATVERRLFKDDAKVKVRLKKYANEQEMFLDALRANARHGRNLTKYDRTHAVILADRLGVPHAAVAGALDMTVDRVSELAVERTAKAERLTVPIKRTIRHMAGKRLTRRQQEANVRLGGMDAKFYIRQLIDLLEADLLDPEDEQLPPLLGRLGELLRKWLTAKQVVG